MAVELDQIRAAAERVAAGYGLEIVDVEFVGAGKARSLRVYVEKNVEGRAALKLRAAEDSSSVPSGVPVEALSGVTHEDCAVFAQEFGVVVDVEDLVPGTAEYTLEVSSPGIERRLYRAADYERFAGFLVEAKLFTAVAGRKIVVGRMSFAGEKVMLDLSAVKLKGKGKKGAVAPPEVVTVSLGEIERAHLVAEI